MNPREILSYFESRRAAILDLIRALVNIESPSYDAAQSKLVANWVEAEALKTNATLTVERVAAHGYGEHVLIRAFPAAEKSTMLLGHTDTVHPIGTCENNPTRIEDGKFFGCGIFDMKSGIVLMLEALRFFSQAGTTPRRPITALLSCDEEIGSMSGRALVEREARNAETCLVFEPSASGRVKTGRKGTGVFTLKAHGIPAHAGLEPHRGANAILELSRQVEKLHSLSNADAGTTVNVCTMSGGTTINVIPEHAKCTIDVRFSSMDEAARVENAIRSLTAFDDRVTLELSGNLNRPPMERSEKVVALFEKARSIAAEFDYPLDEVQVGGASDGNFVAALGVPVLDGLGVAGDGAHRLDEHILVDDVAKRATLVTMLLASA